MTTPADLLVKTLVYIIITSYQSVGLTDFLMDMPAEPNVIKSSRALEQLPRLEGTPYDKVAYLVGAQPGNILTPENPSGIRPVETTDAIEEACLFGTMRLNTAERQTYIFHNESTHWLRPFPRFFKLPPPPGLEHLFKGPEVEGAFSLSKS